MLKILNKEVTVTTEIPNLQGKYVVPVLDLVSNYQMDNLQYRLGFDSNTAVEALSFVDRVWVESLKLGYDDLIDMNGYAILYLVVDPSQRSIVGVKCDGQPVGGPNERMFTYWIKSDSPYLNVDFGTMYGFSLSEHTPVGRVDQLVKNDSLPDDLDRMFYAKSPFIVADKTLLLKSNLPQLGGQSKRHGGRTRNHNKQQKPRQLKQGYYLGEPEGPFSKVSEAVFGLTTGAKFVVYGDGTVKKS